MKKFLVQTAVYTAVFIVPLAFRTLHINYPFVDGMIRSIPFIFILLMILNVIGLVCVRLLIPYLSFIDGKDVVDTWEEQEKIRKTKTYKILNTLTDVLVFGLLIINGMRGTLILACLAWLSKYTFKISMQTFVDKFQV
ncbi:MAG: hypothetical protein K6E29_02945 [Cyanobacteria bacterium RUI128]|nr:hypothetical protein [Cyanobacteria bacterium RUI128]